MGSGMNWAGGVGFRLLSLRCFYVELLSKVLVTGAWSPERTLRLG